MKKIINVSTKRDNFKFSNYLKTIFLCLLIFQFVGFSVSADNLNAVAATGTDPITTTVGYETIATTAGLTVAAGDKVMVIASFTCKSTGADKVARDIYFKIVEDILGTPVSSNEIIRQLTGISGGDEGIGTLVAVFTISGATTPRTYTIQHKMVGTAKPSESTATITAINLTTSGTEALNNSFMAITGGIDGGVETEIGTFATVTGTVSGAITLPVPGGLYFAASINSLSSTGTSSNEGEWQLQYKKESSGSWINLGNPVQRTLGNSNVEGIVSIVNVLENQPAGDYYFQLLHRISGGSSFTLTTFNTSVVGLALSTALGEAFSTFKEEVATVDNTTTSFVTASTNTFTAAGTQAFLHAQYIMSSSNTSVAPGFKFTASGGSLLTTSNINYRALADVDAVGSGGQVGLITDLTATTSYSAYFQTQSTSGLTLTTSEIVFAGFQLTSGRASGFWDGSVDHVWETDANWEDGVAPTASSNVYIPNVTNDPIISGITLRTIASLQIASGALLNIESDAKLTVTGAVTKADAGLLIESTSASLTGSLIFGSGTPNATVQRYIAQNEWHLVTPVTIPTTAYDFYLGSVNLSWLAELNETTNVYDYIIDENASLSRGKPYSYWILDGQGDQTIEFTGTLIGVDVPVTLAMATDGWNLIGNPFPSALNWATVSAGNTKGTAYVWDNSLGGYLYSTGGSGGVPNPHVGTLPNNIIPLGQGFLVQVNTTAGVFTIPEASRVHNTADFVKSANDNKDEITQFIRIDLDGGYYGNTVFVGFPENGTASFDISGDATKLYSSTENIQFFAVENDDELCINANAPLTEGESKTVPLNLVQITDGNYTMGFSDLDQLQNTDITLEDIKTGTTQDIRENTIYTFNASNIDNPGRFLLHIAWAPDGIEDIKDASSNMQIYSFGNEIYIRSKDEAINQGGDVFVYDLMGREHSQRRITASELVKFPINISNNYVVVKVVKQSSTKIQKLFIK